MERVAFISFESGTDLIVSFAVCAPQDFTQIECLTLLRTPKFENLLYEWERGATVSFEREGDEDDAVVLLREVTYAAEEKTVMVVSERSVYKLDVAKVDAKELKEMRRVLLKMNHDSSIKLNGM